MISSDAMRGYNDVLILAIYIKAIRTVTKLAKKFANEPPDDAHDSQSPPFTPPSTV